MKLPKLNAQVGDIFCVIYGEFDDTYIHGPYRALGELSNDDLARAFVLFVENQSEEELSVLADRASTPILRGLPGGYEPVSTAFVAWLEEAGKVERLNCHVAQVSTGDLANGRKFVAIDGSRIEYGEAETPGPLGSLGR